MCELHGHFQIVGRSHRGEVKGGRKAHLSERDTLTVFSRKMMKIWSNALPFGGCCWLFGGLSGFAAWVKVASNEANIAASGRSCVKIIAV